MTRVKLIISLWAKDRRQLARLSPLGVMVPARRGISTECSFGQFPCGQNKPTIEKFVACAFVGTDPASNEAKCKKGSDNARLLFRSKSECQQFVDKFVQGRTSQCTTDNPLAVRTSAEVFVRHARQWDERLTVKLLLSFAANQLITSHFQHTEGITAALVVDRKNARVRITDWMSGFTMPIFKMVMEHCVHEFGA